MRREKIHMRSIERTGIDVYCFTGFTIRTGIESGHNFLLEKTVPHTKTIQLPLSKNMGVWN